MRCHAVLLEAEVYRELEVQILEQLKTVDRQTFKYLLMDNVGEVELLSGEARVLFEAAGDFFQHVDLPERRQRMAVAPEEVNEFLSLWTGEAHDQRLAPISFNLPQLRAAMESRAGDVGLVLVEESEDWEWVCLLYTSDAADE